MSYKVMIVDDAAMMRLYISSFLKSLPEFNMVAQAANGQEALDKLSDYPDLDLILLDIEMPVMDGLQATEAIRGLEGDPEIHIPVVGLTAHASAEDRERCLQAGMDGYLTKPLNLSDLDKVLADVMNRELIPC